MLLRADALQALKNKQNQNQKQTNLKNKQKHLKKDLQTISEKRILE